MSISWIGFVTKLIPHVGRIDDLLEAADEFLRAEGLDARWVATKNIGDILVPILATVTGLSFEDEDKAVGALGLFDGSRIGKLKEFFNSPTGQALFQFLLGQILKAA